MEKTKQKKNMQYWTLSNLFNSYKYTYRTRNNFTLWMLKILYSLSVQNYPDSTSQLTTHLFPNECWLTHTGLCLSGFCFPCMVCVGVCGNLCTFSRGQNQWYTQDSPSFLSPWGSYLALCLDGWSSCCVCILFWWSATRKVTLSTFYIHGPS